MKIRVNLVVLLVGIILTLSVVLPGCASQDSAQISPVDSLAASPTSNTQLFRSDQFYFTIQLSQDWAVAEGPESLFQSKIKGYVAFNSWGLKGFWARAVETANGFTYGGEALLSQIPAGEAYIVLDENVSLAAPPDYEHPAYTLVDLSGLFTPHDWRQDASAQAQSFSLFKWDRYLVFYIACRSDASDSTVNELNHLLQSWKFDAILPGDPGWAFPIARSLLPAQVGPDKFPGKKGGTAWDYNVPAVRTTQVEVRQDKTVHFRFTYFWNLPADLTPGPVNTPSETYHWWEIDVLPSGKAVLYAQGGIPLPTSNVPSTSPTLSFEQNGGASET
jgi:hypothetical protein